MTPPELRTLITAGESQTLEFKSTFDKAAIQSLAAFANAQGGRVLVGISNSGQVIGATLGKETLNEWLGQSLRNKLVAEGFYLTNLIEKYGSGFIRIRNALKDYPGVGFEVQEFQGGVMASFILKQPESQPESLAQRVLGLLSDGPLSKQELSLNLGQQAVSGPLNKVIRELLRSGKIEQTHPDKPNSRLQKYRLTKQGRATIIKRRP